MQKKVLALAVAGALAPAAALAQTSTVQIFGTVYVEYDYINQGRGGAAAATGGDIANRKSVDFLQAPGSELGFKGEEQLGGGMSAWFQCASTMNFINEGPSAGGNGSTTTGSLCTRNSALGLKGGWGNFFVGRWDTPFKRTISPTAVGSNDTGLWGNAFLLTGGSTSTSESATRATFKRRQANMLSYDSPVFGGFQVLAGYSANNGHVPSTGAVAAGTAATTGATASKPRVYSIGAQYSAGPLFVSTAYERHTQASAVGGNLDDDAWQLGAAYTWGPVKFGGTWTRQKFEMTGSSAAAIGLGGLGSTGGGSSQAKYDAWTLGADWNIVGPHSLRASFTRAEKAKGGATNLVGPAVGGAFATTNAALGGTYRPAPCLGTGATAALAAAAVNCGGTQASLWQLRYVYTMSKRTEFNIGGAWLDNSSQAAYSLGGVVSPQIGENQWGYGISLKHTF